MVNELLIVDDHQGIRLLLKEVFEKEGYLVHLANNGAEAMHLIERNTVHCILLDMKIPDMSGLEIIKKIKEIEQEIPVIMMSGFSEQDLVQQAMEHGASCFFTKPFNIHELVESVKSSALIG